MPHEPKHHHLLTAHEVELLACYRAMDEQAKAATVYMMAALSMGCRDFVEPAKLTLVSKD